MTNYYMPRQRRKILIKKIFWVTVICAVAFGWLYLASKHDEAVMKVQYCWDAQGNHFVAPNQNCLVRP